MLSAGPVWKDLTSAGTPSGAESARRTLEGAKAHVQREHKLVKCVKCVFHVHSHDLDLDTLQMFSLFAPLILITNYLHSRFCVGPRRRHQLRMLGDL